MPEPGKRRRVDGEADSLMPKRMANAIQGVSSSSMVGLNAQVKKVEQRTRDKGRGKGYDGTSLRSTGIDVSKLSQANRGVKLRDAQDRTHVMTDADKFIASRTKLEQKAELYDSYASGRAAPTEDCDVEFHGGGGLSPRPRDQPPPRLYGNVPPPCLDAPNDLDYPQYSFKHPDQPNRRDARDGYNSDDTPRERGSPTYEPYMQGSPTYEAFWHDSSLDPPDTGVHEPQHGAAGDERPGLAAEHSDDIHYGGGPGELKKRTQQLLDEETLRKERRQQQKRLVMEVAAEERRHKDTVVGDRKNAVDKATQAKQKLLNRFVNSQLEQKRRKAAGKKTS